MLSKIKDSKIKEFCKKLNKGEVSNIDFLNEIRILELEFFWHPLGFILGTYLSNDNEKIRVHIWPNKDSKPQIPYWNIHNHIFDLTSWVLEGEITNKEYSISNEKDSDQCVYKVNYNGIESSLNKTEQNIVLKEVKCTVNPKGSVYSIDAAIFHQSIRTSQESAITIVLSIDKECTNPLVIGDIYSEEEYRYYRKKVNLEYFEKLMNELTENITNPRTK